VKKTEKKIEKKADKAEKKTEEKAEKAEKVRHILRNSTPFIAIMPGSSAPFAVLNNEIRTACSLVVVLAAFAVILSLEVGCN
jgi:hypothetical protein